MTRQNTRGFLCVLQLVIEHQLKLCSRRRKTRTATVGDQESSFSDRQGNPSIVIFTSESKDVRAFKCFAPV